MLAYMIKLALKIENREVVRRECGLSSAYGGKQQLKLPLAKHTAPPIANDTQLVGSWPMRTITLKESRGERIGGKAKRRDCLMLSSNHGGRRGYALDGGEISRRTSMQN